MLGIKAYLELLFKGVAFLSIAFSVWFHGLSWLLGGVFYCLNIVLPLVYSDFVQLLSKGGGVFALLSSMPLLDGPTKLILLDIPVRRFSISLPIFYALIFLVEKPIRARIIELLLGGTVLFLGILLSFYLFMQFGLALIINQTPMFGDTAQSSYALSMPYSDWQYYLFALGRQFSLLVLPIFLPIMLFLGLNKSLLTGKIGCAG